MKSFISHLLLFLLGIAMLGGSYYFGKDTPAKLFVWDSAPGKIFGYTKKATKSFTGLRIKFMYNEKEYEFTSNLNTKNYVHNERIGVIFPKGHPEQAEARSFLWLFGLPGFLLFVGLILCMIGFTVMKRRVLGKPDPAPIMRDYRER